jgi:hypothetical protein
MAGWRDYLVVGGLAVVGMWWGGHHIKLAVEECEPLEISCADYLANKPAAHYLRLTGCEPDFEHMAKETTKGEVTAVYVPLRPVGETGAPHIVVERDDEEICHFVRSSALPNELSAEDRVVVDSLSGPQVGVVKFGIDLSEDTRSKLEHLDLGLAPDFVLLDEGARPHLWWGLIACAASLLGLGWALRSIVRRLRG